MGTLTYGDSTRVEIEDGLLSHLEHVIGDKLRLSEPFMFQWRMSPQEGGGRRSIWLNGAAHIVFAYIAPTAPTLNRTWLQALSVRANSSNGLILVGRDADEVVERAPAAPSIRTTAPTL